MQHIEETFPEIIQAVQDKRLIDIGAQASKYGGMDNQGTCKLNDTTACLRRDYVFANDWGERLIQNFNVSWDADIKTHAIITVTLNSHVEDCEYEVVRMPTTIKEHFCKDLLWAVWSGKPDQG